MNLAFVSFSMPGATGVGTTTFNQACMTAEAGCKVALVLPKPYKDEALEKCGVEVVVIPPTRSLASLGMSLRARLGFTKASKAVTPTDIDIIKFASGVGDALPEIVKTRNIGCVLFSESFMEYALWNAPKGTKTAIRFACPRYLFQKIGLSNQPVNPALHKIELEKVPEADVLYTPTKKMRSLAADYYGISVDKFSVVPNPVDARIFKPPKNPAPPRSVFFAGRFSKEKGAEAVMEVIPPLMIEFKDLTFTILGDSEIEADKTPLAEKFGHRLEETGCSGRFFWKKGVLRSEMPGIIGGHAILFHPSLFDNFSLSVLEAQVCGLPVVAANTGGTSEVIQNGVTGMLAPAKDSTAMSAALRKLLLDPEHARKMGLAGRKRATENFSYDVVSKALLKIISS